MIICGGGLSTIPPLVTVDRVGMGKLASAVGILNSSMCLLLEGDTWCDIKS